MGLGPMEAYTTFKVVLNETSQMDKWQMKTRLAGKDKESINQDRSLTARISIC